MKKLSLILVAFIFATSTFSQSIKPVKVPTMSGGIKWAYQNSNGEKVTKAKYTDAKELVNGFAIVKDENNKYGFIDSTGKEITPLKYENVRNFSNGFASVATGYEERGYINKAGKEITPLKYCNYSAAFSYYEKDFNERGFAFVDKAFYKNGYADKYFPGVIDNTGKEIISPDDKYFRIHELKNHYYKAEKSGRFTLFSPLGKKVSEERFKVIVAMSEDTELFIMINDEDKSGIMDKNGKWLLKPVFYDITRFQFSNDRLAKVSFDKETYFYIDKNCKCIETDDAPCPEE